MNDGATTVWESLSVTGRFRFGTATTVRCSWLRTRLVHVISTIGLAEIKSLGEPSLTQSSGLLEGLSISTTSTLPGGFRPCIRLFIYHPAWVSILCHPPLGCC